MKVMWLCNIMLPRISRALNIKAKPIGGWLTGLSDDILENTDTELTIMFPSSKEELTGVIDDFHYYGFAPRQNNVLYFIFKIKEINPDVIHIFGTEYSHSYKMIEACKHENVLYKTIVSIQGLTSIYSKHYYCGLPGKVIHSNSFHDFLRRSNIYHGKKNFEKSGKLEITTLKTTNNVIGRTQWDYALTHQINPKVNYYFCNETLRHVFYEGCWDIEKAEKHSIFVSQANYPIKGFHYMLEAFSIIKKCYPDAKLYTTGFSPLKRNIIDKARQNSYSIYIGKLIKKYRIQDDVHFLGILDDLNMKNRYLQSHVFASCSSIENSPNSVGEAMLLGVPVVASDVGGVKDMLTDKEDGMLYPYDEPYMLAYYIMEIFKDNESAVRMSKNARDHAAITHSRKKNLNCVMDIYHHLGSQ